ncbi:MAG: M23/M56 family metallopeptidase [Gemmiger sp.]|uniref:M23/M56 family metallopeptidase n=2 Tax=Gemmiger TaxID=204475 RepID=UPI002E7A112F|nr:M23/M56 family metallopeptidase [Gemmiger sp.]MEE0412569.1 M23/M56 family metallopeptidase [Gemmiger sp.]
MRSTVFAFLLLSARGGAAALAAWAVCKLLRRAHAPSRLLCWLWLAVGLRFVLPCGIPLSLPRPQNTQLAAAADTVQELGELPLVAPPPAVSAPAAALPWYARLTPWHALAAVWAVGVAVLAVRGIVGYIKLKCHVALACKTSDGCYSGACVTAPFTLGILRPRVYLPDDLQGTARQAVLLHEQTHIRRRDPLTKPLFYAVACLHWFNPLVWLAFCTFERDMEAACDEAAVRGRPLPERNAYCESLLHFAVQGRSIPGSLAFGQGSVKERIVHLLHYRRLGAGALAVCAAVVGLSVTACMVRPQVEDAPATAAPPATAETAEPTPTPAPTSVPAVAAAALPTLDNAANSPRFICPVKYKYISRFATNGHRGDDLCAAEGTEIYAAADGVVLAAQEHYSWGNFVEIDHGADANGLRWSTLYAHMQSCAVQVGQTVTAGQVIGYVGSTGNATGNACHFEMQVNGTLVEPRYFTAYGGSDAAELTQEKADEILAEAVRRAASDQVTAADGAALSGVDLFTLPVAPPPQVSGYDPENGHPGIDFAAEEGAEVYAVAGGIVTAADYDVEKGNYVVLDHGGGLETEYQHMKSLLVSAGQSVVQGQVLGYVGSTGNSTGPHLHFEARQDGAPADLTGTALLAE